ncbi:uncharacterized protein OCT59_017700 [Rhizophagus irregularis]|uniref:uncharacterized protein n=1 Tax=Rhizophagus irregularis TaxID=588596 RepID=UPI00331EEE10|nr:hypothetical protein OCT59_017700 [Rhizophagus irregularis]
MLMWEISFGQPPFMNYEHDYIFAIDIIDAFYISRSNDFSLSDNTSNHSKSSKINFKDNDSKESSRLFKKLKMENVDVQNDYDKREIMQQRSNISINDEVQNNPNLHSEDKDKTPDDGF